MLVAQKWESSGVGGRYTVTFNLSGGKIGESSSDVIVYNVPRGKRIGKIKPSTNPYKRTDGEVYGGINPFVGWNVSDDTRVLSDITVYATYESGYILDWFASNNTAHNGTYTFESGTYQVTVVGGGGKGAGDWSPDAFGRGNRFAAAGGGSGASFSGVISLPTRTVLSISIGGSQTDSGVGIGGSNIIFVPKGSNGSASANGYGQSASGGAGGSRDSISINTAYVSETGRSSGNSGGQDSHQAIVDWDSGAWVGGGGSVIANTSYGEGGGGGSGWNTRYAGEGLSGYVKIERI